MSIVLYSVCLFYTAFLGYSIVQLICAACRGICLGVIKTECYVTTTGSNQMKPRKKLWTLSELRIPEFYWKSHSFQTILTKGFLHLNNTET